MLNDFDLNIVTDVPTTLPRAGEPPVTEKDCAGLLAKEKNHV